MRMLRSLFLVLLLAVGIVVAVFLAVPALTYFLISGFWFRFRNHGKRFLVYSRRHGWNEFIVNNLVPVVHRDVEVVMDPTWRSRLLASARFSNPLCHIRAAKAADRKRFVERCAVLCTTARDAASLQETSCAEREHPGGTGQNTPRSFGASWLTAVGGYSPITVTTTVLRRGLMSHSK